MPKGCRKAILYVISGFLAMGVLFAGMTLMMVIFGGISDMAFLLIVLLSALFFRIYLMFYYQRPKQKRKRT